MKKIKNISQETANQLCEQFDELRMVEKEKTLALKHFLTSLALTLLEEQISCISRAVNYSIKSHKATFLTRWYWRRKDAKETKNANDWGDFANCILTEVKKIENNDEQAERRSEGTE